MPKKIEFHFKSPEEGVGYLLGQLTMLWQRRQKKIQDPLDLTQTQFALLAALGWLLKEDVPVTQVDIANQSNSDRMMASKVLRTLEEKGFITRQAHQSDTRAKTIGSTSAGEAVLQTALVEVENADLEFFAALGSRIAPFNKSMARLISVHKN